MTNTLLTRHDPAEARRHREQGLWGDETHYGLMRRNAESHPDQPALRDGGTLLSWRQLEARVDIQAAELRAAGLRSGDRVALWMSNRVEAVIAFLACSRDGFVCCPSFHRNGTPEDAARLIERLSARAVLVEEGWASKDPFPVLEGIASLAWIRRLPPGREPAREPSPSVAADQPDATGAPGAADGDRPADGAGGPAPGDNADSICYAAFTSGTTGTPKCVMHSDNTLLANARDLVRDWGHGRDTVLLSLSPLSHHIAWVGVGQWLLSGGVFVTDDPPAGKGRLDWLLKTGATYVMGVPTHAIDILAELRRCGGDSLGAVTCFYMAGAPIPPSVAEAFLAMGVIPQNVYGMSENSSHQYTLPDDPPEIVTGTCGRGGRAYTIRIFDQTDPDREVPAGEVGQIGGRGACLMLGYFDDQTATETSFNREGWFLSGDLGALDEAGNLTVVGRLKDVIIRGGHNIHPARIEDIAIKHAAVDKAAAFAVPDERLGEKVCLAVLPGDPALDAQEILNHLHRAGLPLSDMPEYFIAMPEFPLTASGKILKRALAADARDGTLIPDPVRFTPPREKP